jgi:hypothetical protein
MKQCRTGFWGQLRCAAWLVLLPALLTGCGSGGSLAGAGSPATGAERVNLTLSLHVPPAVASVPAGDFSAPPRVGAVASQTTQFVIHVLDAGTHKEVTDATAVSASGEAVQAVTLSNLPAAPLLIEVDSCDASGAVLEHSLEPADLSGGGAGQAVDVSFGYTAAEAQTTYNYVKFLLPVSGGSPPSPGQPPPLTSGQWTRGTFVFDDQGVHTSPQVTSSTTTTLAQSLEQCTVGSDGTLSLVELSDNGVTSQGFLSQDRTLWVTSGWLSSLSPGGFPPLQTLRIASPPPSQGVVQADLKGTWRVSQFLLPQAGSTVTPAVVPDASAGTVSVSASGDWSIAGSNYTVTPSTSGPGVLQVVGGDGTSTLSPRSSGFLSYDKQLMVLTTCDQNQAGVRLLLLVRDSGTIFEQARMAGLWDMCSIAATPATSTSSVVSHGSLLIDGSGSILPSQFHVQDPFLNAETLSNPPTLTVSSDGLITDTSRAASTLRGAVTSLSNLCVVTDDTPAQEGTQASLRVLRRR